MGGLPPKPQKTQEATFVAPPGSDRQLVHYPFFHKSNVRKMINVIFNFHSSKIGKTTLISIIWW